MALDGGTIADTAVEVVANTDRFEPDLRKKLDGAGAAGGKAFDRAVQRATDRTGREVGEKIARDSQGTAGRAGISWGDAFRIGIASRLSGTQIKQLFAPFSAIASVMAFSLVSAGAASSIGPLLTFAAAVGQAGGAVFALPAAMAVGAAALGVLKVATAGFSDAIGAAAQGDARAYAKAVEGMAPPARAVLGEFRALVPQLNQVRDAVQIEFWSRLQGQLTAVAGVLMGPVGRGMTLVAGSSSAVALGLAQILQEAESARLLGAVFDTTAGAVDRLNPGILATVTGLRDLTGVGLPLMDQLSASVGTTAVRFGEWLSHVSASGQAWTWIQNAMTTLRQLGVVFSQVGGIISAVLTAAQTSSGGLLGTLGQLLTGVNAFLSSAQGQQLLVTIFTSLAAVGQALLPVLLALGGAVGMIAPQLAGIATALGPALASAIGALGPALAALGPGLTAVADGLAAAFADPEMAAGLLSLGQSLSQVLVAITPLLPVLGQLVVLVANIFARALTQAAPLVTLLAEALVFVLTPVLGLIDGMNRLVFVMGQWLQFDVIAGILDRIGSAARGVTGFFSDLLNAASSIDLGAAVSSVGGFVQSVLDWFAGLPSQVAGFLSQVGTTVLDFFVSLPGLILQGLAALPGLLLDALVFAAEAVGYGIGLIIGIIVGFPVLVYNVVVGLGQLLYNALLAAWTWAYQAVVTGVTAIVNFVVGLPGMVVAAVAALGGMLAGWASAAWAWAQGAFVAGVNAVVNFAVSLPGRVVAAVSGLAGMLGGWASSAWSAATGAFSAGVSGIISFVSSLPGRIVSALGSVGSLLYSAGTQIIQGLLNGLRSAVGQVWSFVSSIADRIAAIKGPLPYDRRLLIPHGRALMLGLDEGIRTEFATVRSTLAGITRGIPLTVAVAPTRMAPSPVTATRNGISLTPSLVPRGGGRGDTHVTVNAPVSVSTAATDADAVAFKTADRLGREIRSAVL